MPILYRGFVGGFATNKRGMCRAFFQKCTHFPLLAILIGSFLLRILIKIVISIYINHLEISNIIDNINRKCYNIFIILYIYLL